MLLTSFRVLRLRFVVRKQFPHERGGLEKGSECEVTILTALHVFISTLFLRCSSTLSRFPARAARKNEVFPSDCELNRKLRFIKSMRIVPLYINVSFI